jgi:hypothetical protein
LRHPRSTSSARVRVVRSILAAALACLVAAASVPSGAVSAEHGCQMPCCKGKVGGRSGDGDGESCHVNLNHLQPAPTPEPVEAEPMCGATPPPATRGGAAQAPHGHSDDDAPHSAVRHGIEHGAHQDVPPRNTSPHAPAVSASVSKPCPPDCGALSNSFTQLRRPRDGAALAYGVKPRPPTVAVLPPARAGASKTSSELRRQSSPRAPPSTPPAD